MRETLTRREQQTIAQWLKSGSAPLTIREISARYSITVALTESLISRFDIPYRPTPTDPFPLNRLTEEWQRVQQQRQRAAAQASLAREIALAKAEAPRAKPYRGRTGHEPLVW